MVTLDSPSSGIVVLLRDLGPRDELRSVPKSNCLSSKRESASELGGGGTVTAMYLLAKRE